MYLFSTVLRYIETLVENRRFNLPHLYLAPLLGVIPSEFRRDFWPQKARFPGLSYSVAFVILSLAIFAELRLMADRQTDGRTDRDTMTAYIALA